MKFAKLLCPLLANTEAFGDTDKSSIGIPKIGEDLTVSCEGTLLSMTLIRTPRTELLVHGLKNKFMDLRIDSRT